MKRDVAMVWTVQSFWQSRACRPLVGAAFMLVCLRVAAADAATADPTSNRPHNQWQPQTEQDARLQQPVHVEILGRAAVPALELLSQQTGVTLRVAPENLDTVGDRKLTVIAQGCSLKSLLVQIPNALQECHWDVDVTGAQPVYLLHRNGSADDTVAELVDLEERDRQAEARPRREARIAEARKALTMSGAELDELAKSDPLLAGWVSDAPARQRLKLLLALPSQNLEELLAAGSTCLAYTAAPEAVQGMIADWLKKDGAGDPADQEQVDRLIAALPEAVLHFEDDFRGICPSLLWFDAKGELGPKGGFSMTGGGPALPPRLPTDRPFLYEDPLLALGMTKADADALLTELAKGHDRQKTQARNRERALEWREPHSPELHREVVLPFRGEVDPVEVQRFVAEETGLSVVSDYFTAWGLNAVPEEAEAALPIWRLLYLLGENWFWTYEWDEVGDCLVFHDRHWYRQALQELPESIVTALRAKLKRQAYLSLDDVVAAVVELERRRPLPTALRDGQVCLINTPPDLQEAGFPLSRSEVLLLYASLSPKQRDVARGALGLPCAEMTVGQRDVIRRYHFFPGGLQWVGLPTSEEDVMGGVFHIRQTEGASGSVPYEQVRLWLELPKFSVLP